MKRPSSSRILFGERLRNLREERNMSQKEVAEYIGRTNRSVSNYENGINYPDPECIEMLAELFGVKGSYLTGCDDGGYQIQLSERETEMIRGFRLQPLDVQAKIYAYAIEKTVYDKGRRFIELMSWYEKAESED